MEWINMQDKQPGKELFIAACWHTVFKEFELLHDLGFSVTSGFPIMYLEGRYQTMEKPIRY